MKIERWSKIKNGVITRIGKKTPIQPLLDEGYTISHLVTEGNKTKIQTYSPLTRQEHYEKQKKQLGGFTT